MADRIPCCVIGCKRSAPRKKFDTGETEIICGKCWRSTDKRLRRRYTRLKRVPEARWKWFHWHLWQINWRRLRESAAEAKAGIR